MNRLNSFRGIAIYYTFSSVIFFSTADTKELFRTVQPRFRALHTLTHLSIVRYWDWTIDWEDPARSPLFSPTSGFGGNGNTSGSTALTNGYCVAEGPFSGLQLQFWGAARRPHCLSRRFNETVFGRRHIKPEIMRSNLALDDYMEFLIAIEHYSHNTIPIAIGGDFASFMAPGGMSVPNLS